MVPHSSSASHRELGELPIANALGGAKMPMRPLAPHAVDDLAAFVAHLPHVLPENVVCCVNPTPAFCSVPVDAQRHNVVKDWFAYATRHATLVSKALFEAAFRAL